MQILNIKNIEFEKQGKILFKIEKLSINTGDIIGLIGKNGCKCQYKNVQKWQNKNVQLFKTNMIF